jgi:hypothetical protein
MHLPPPEQIQQAECIKIVSQTIRPTPVPEKFLTGSKNLQKLIIGRMVSPICHDAFSQCCSLHTLVFDKYGDIFQKIEDRAFSQCSSLRKIVLPEEIFIIGRYSFAECSALRSVEIRGGVSSCPNCIKTIEEYAFSNCRSLVEVVLSGFGAIGDYAFAGCKQLQNIRFTENCCRIGVGKCAFSGCAALDSVLFPVYVLNIGERAFAGCEQLQSIEFARGCSVIGANAFSECTARSIVFNGDVGDIMANAFGGCTAHSIVFNGKVGMIGRNAFSQCPNLSSVVIKDVEVVGEGAFSQCQSLSEVTIYCSDIGARAFAECSQLQSVITSAKNIGERAFTGCSALYKVNMWPVVNIGSYAFEGCERLQLVELTGEHRGGNLVTIGESAFKGCSSLEKIVIPNSIHNIYDSAFKGCSQLWSIEFVDLSETIDRSACHESMVASFVDRNSLQLRYIGGWAFADTNLSFIDLSKCKKLPRTGDPRGLLASMFGPLPKKDCVVILPFKFGRCAYSVYKCSGFGEQRWKLFTQEGRTANTWADYDTVVSQPTYANRGLFPVCWPISRPKDEIVTIGGGQNQDNLLVCGYRLGDVAAPQKMRVSGGAFGPSIKYIDLSKTSELYEQDPYVADAWLKLQKDEDWGAILGRDDRTFLDGIVRSTLEGGQRAGWCAVHLPEIRALHSRETIPSRLWGRAGGIWRPLRRGRFPVIRPQDPILGPQSLAGAEMVEFDFLPSAQQLSDTDDVKSISFNPLTFPKNATVGEDFFGFFPNLRHIVTPEQDETSTFSVPRDNTSIRSVVVSNHAENEENQIAHASFMDSRLRKATVLDGVKHIRSGFFACCPLLKSIEIPGSVESIGGSAFSNSGIENVDFGDSKLTEIKFAIFSGCTKLRSIVIPKSIVVIHGCAFAGSSGLKHVAFEPGSSLTTINADAFRGCIFDSIVIPSSVFAIGNNAFEESAIKHIVFEPGSKLKTITAKMFDGCKLGSIVIPASVTLIEDGAFDAMELDSVTFEPGSRLAEITAGTFRNCHVKSIVIPTATKVASFADMNFDHVAFETGYQLATITTDMFRSSSVKSIVIPASVTEIVDGAFTCTTLEHVSFEPGSRLGKITAGMFRDCPMKSIVIPANVTAIECEALACPTLEQVSFEPGSRLEKITARMFSGCHIKSIVIPANVTVIEYGGFAYSTFEQVSFEPGSRLKEITAGMFAGGTIKSIVIPTNVIVIDKGAFIGTGLERISFEPKSNLNSIGPLAFAGCPLEFIKIPTSVSNIAPNAFDSSGLKYVAFEKNSCLQELKANTFAECNLEIIELPAALVTIDPGAFGDVKHITFQNDDIVSHGFFGTRTAAPSGSLFKCQPGAFGYRSLERVVLPAGVCIESLRNVFKGINTNAVVEFQINAQLRQGSIDELIPPKGLDASVGCKAVRNGEIFELMACYYSAVHQPRLGWWYRESQTRRSASFNTAKSRLDSFSQHACDHVGDVGDAVPHIAVIPGPLVTVPSNIQIISSKNGWAGSDVRSVIFAPGAKRALQIEDGAFKECRYLSTITIPVNVSSIAVDAFAGSGVFSVLFEPGIRLQRLQGFMGCKNLDSITIPGSVRAVGEQAFEGSGVCSVFFEKDSALTEIESRAFSGCAKLRSITIPGNVITIHNEAFKDSGLRSVSFEKSSRLETIKADAFANCRLKRFNVPPGVTMIEPGALSRAELIDFSENIEARKSIGSEKFVKFLDNGLKGCQQGCIAEISRGTWKQHFMYYDEKWRGLAPISKPTDLQHRYRRGADILPGVDISLCTFTGVRALVLQDDYVYVHTLSPETLKDISSLEYIKIPDSVCRIEARTFCTYVDPEAERRDNIKQTEIVIGEENGLEYIGSSAFTHCILGDVVLHQGIELENGAFFGARWGTIDLSEAFPPEMFDEKINRINEERQRAGRDPMSEDEETEERKETIKGRIDDLCRGADEFNILLPACNGCKFIVSPRKGQRVTLELEMKDQRLGFIERDH